MIEDIIKQSFKKCGLDPDTSFKDCHRALRELLSGANLDEFAKPR
jgi:hypothetical protein